MMREVRIRILSIVAAMAMLICTGACNTVNDEQIPSLPVNLNLSPLSLWQTYGVSAFGESREFIKPLQIPRNFSYLERSATGFGGVLLVMGFNPYTGESMVPMAYDLACPVECRSDIRVRMVAGEALPEAVCPECGSVYNVTEQGGAPVSGEALSIHVGLRRYQCLSAQGGGYLILN